MVRVRIKKLDPLCKESKAQKKQGRILGIRCVLQASERRRYGPTDRQTDGRTDGRTDRPYYRDARTHLNIGDQRLAFVFGL